MRLLNYIVCATATAFPLVSSFAIEKRANDDIVTISFVRQSTVKVTIANNGAQEISLLSAGSFLDMAPLYKATVFKNGNSACS